LLNILKSLNANLEVSAAYATADEPVDWKSRNQDLTPLHLNYELRIADAHETHGEIVKILENLGLDTATLNQGYGHALDAAFDGVIGSFGIINSELIALLDRQDRVPENISLFWCFAGVSRHRPVSQTGKTLSLTS
jgi:hypothetical protein